MDISRQELFEQAWSKPMTELAKTFGVSNVAIAKAYLGSLSGQARTKTCLMAKGRPRSRT